MTQTAADISNLTRQTRFSPLGIMLAALVLAAGFVTATLWLSLERPIVDLPAGARVIALGDIVLTQTDLIEEPDQLPDIAAQLAFFKRQSTLAAQLQHPRVEITLLNDAPDAPLTQSLTPRPTRLADLGHVFWFQLIVGVLALLIGAWVLALRQNDLAAWMFALTGLFLPVSTTAAAVYSTRQIALPGPFFSALSGVNHLGAGLFGMALVAMWAMYPRPLFRPRWLLLVVAVFGVLLIGDVSWRFTFGRVNLALTGMNEIVSSQMLLAIVLGVLQWRRSRTEPLDRAGLRWFLLTSLLGCSLFIGLVSLPVLTGLTDENIVPQSYAFGFFLVMHVGLALGLTRYKVFNLDHYAYYAWLWLASAALVLVLDLAVLNLLQDQPWASLSVALLLAGFLYFPLRQLLLRRLLAPREVALHSHLPDVVSLSLAQTPGQRETLWDDLLTKVFTPAAAIEHLPHPVARSRLQENGLGLVLAGNRDVAPRRLRYANRGRRLFTPRDVQAAEALLEFQRVAGESREAFARGMSTERDRISRDMHDNIGAQLLSALHSGDISRKDGLLRDTLSDLRTLINDGFRRDYVLGDILADMRAEVAERLSDCNVTLDWDQSAFDTGFATAHPVLGYAQTSALRAVLREAISNVVKHADATRVQVSVLPNGNTLRLEILDDGRGLPPDNAALRKDTNGLSNIRARATAVGGQALIVGLPRGVKVVLELPLETSPGKAAE